MASGFGLIPWAVTCHVLNPWPGDVVGLTDAVLSYEERRAGATWPRVLVEYPEVATGSQPLAGCRDGCVD